MSKTYYANSTLNRFSFLRTDVDFLNAAYNHSSAKFLVLKNLEPPTERLGKKHKLIFKSRNEIQSLLPPTPNSRAPTIVFLGLDESVPTFQHSPTVQGQPYFSISFASIIDGFQDSAYATAPMALQLSIPESALYGQARMATDWLLRTPFCAQCGSATKPIEAGTKLQCSNSKCLTRTTLSNHAFPRTDVSIIVAVTSGDGRRVLLGRGRTWPKKFYSCLAGFLEFGESVEDCVCREVLEETGVVVDKDSVVIHSTQPWPFPANIMVGCIAKATDETIDLGRDQELADAKWFSNEEVEEVMKGKGQIYIPPKAAIARTLIEYAVNNGKNLSKI